MYHPKGLALWSLILASFTLDVAFGQQNIIYQPFPPPVAFARSRCPPAKEIQPCKCIAKRIKSEIICSYAHGSSTNRPSPSSSLNTTTASQSHLNELDLQRIFAAIRSFHVNRSKATPSPSNAIYYDKLHISWPNLAQLGPNVFQGVKFGKLELVQCPKLTYIDPHAFEGTQDSLEEVFILFTRLSNSSSSDKAFFTALNSLTNLKRAFIGPSFIQLIPDHAFSRPMNQLEKIKFLGNKIKRIGKNAFANMPNLRELTFQVTFAHQPLIEASAFQLYESSEAGVIISIANSSVLDTSIITEQTSSSTTIAPPPLKLVFHDRRINAHTFSDPRVFADLVKASSTYGNSITLDLSGSKIEYLNKDVFYPILEANPSNTILMKEGSQLDCQDCRNNWLLQTRYQFQSQITDVYCRQSKSSLMTYLFKVTESSHC